MSKSEIYLDLEKLSQLLGYFNRGVEYLANPSFEDELKGWITYGTGSEEIIDGRVKGKAIRLKPAVNDYRTLLSEQMFPVIPRHAIHWTFWARMPGVGSIQALVKFYDSKKEDTFEAYPCPIQKHPDIQPAKVYYGPMPDWTPILAWYDPMLDSPLTAWYTVAYPSTGAAYFRIGFRTWTPSEGGGADIDDVHLYLSDAPQVNPDRKLYVRKSCLSGGRALWLNKSVTSNETSPDEWVEEFEHATVIIRVDAATEIYLQVSFDGSTWYEKATPIKSFTAAGEDIIDLPITAPIYVRFRSSAACTITLILMLKG
jgi:hypothetical protein